MTLKLMLLLLILLTLLLLLLLLLRKALILNLMVRLGRGDGRDGCARAGEAVPCSVGAGVVERGEPAQRTRAARGARVKALQRVSALVLFRRAGRGPERREPGQRGTASVRDGDR